MTTHVGPWPAIRQLHDAREHDVPALIADCDEGFARCETTIGEARQRRLVRDLETAERGWGVWRVVALLGWAGWATTVVVICLTH